MKNNSKNSKRALQLYWQFAWNYPRYVVPVLILLPITVVSNSYLPPLVLASVISKLSQNNIQADNIWTSFGPSILIYIGLSLFSLISWRLVDLFAWRLEGNVQRDIAQRIYNHLLEQSADFHANRFGGSLVSQTNKFMGGYIRVADTTIFQTLALLIGMLAVIVILGPKAPLFVALLVIVAILYIISALFVTRPVRRIGAEHAASESEQTGYLADSITNIMAIKSFSGRKFEQRQFAKQTDKVYGNLIRIAIASQKQMLYLSSLNRVINILALIMAIVSVVVFKTNVAVAFLIFSYTSALVELIWTFAHSGLRTYNRALGDASDMAAILDIKPSIKDPETPEKSRIKDGAIQINHVDFTHKEANNGLFKDLNISVKPGERIGLVGHSGSGKTTLSKLLLRFSDIDAGEILIDGQNITHLTQDDLRRHIAYVPQEPLLFHRTLRENISYGTTGMTEKEVVKAAKVAHADDFIRQLPKKYETLVGERGVKLSGGQRQRIAIARAMLKDAPILVLDEATSALDSESEALIQDALWKLMEGRTAIVIAHRLSTIQKMDRIIVLEDGKIIEEGSHKELLDKSGKYAELWDRQSGGFIES